MIDELEWKREFEDAVADLNPQLLAVGGICVSSQPYDLVDMIADAGENMTLPVETMYMDWGQCHANVSKLWAEGVVDKICTGYALGDEEWVPHSWGIKEGLSLRRRGLCGHILAWLCPVSRRTSLPNAFYETRRRSRRLDVGVPVRHVAGHIRP
jgi:hypothetical protein